jgi:hypothetical protein
MKIARMKLLLTSKYAIPNVESTVLRITNPSPMAHHPLPTQKSNAFLHAPLASLSCSTEQN